jgi:hypothetical protein
VNDRCQGGKCIGYQITCPIDGMNDCTGGCDEATGQCSPTVIKRDGARCQVVLSTLEGMQTSRLWAGSKASCSTSDYQCRSGECVAVQKPRTAGSACTAGDATGTCDGAGSCVTTAGGNNNPTTPITPGGGSGGGGITVGRSPRPRRPRNGSNNGGVPPLSSLVARPSQRPEDGAANGGGSDKPRDSNNGSGTGGTWPVVQASGDSSSGSSSRRSSRSRQQSSSDALNALLVNG